VLPGAARGLVDLGGATGAYAAAFVAALPSARATVVDRPEVLALAPPRPCVRALAADLLDGTAPLGDGYGVALLSHVVHWLAADDARRLVARATGALAPGGWVAVKDFWVADDRRGPPAGVLFALNMALYSDAGDVYPPARVRGWLADAGLVDAREETLAAAPDERVWLARRP
jgi:hypothetical protein